MKVCYQVQVGGEVQGVFFRASAQQQAIELGLSGYARNVEDGEVEVAICGEQDSVDKMIAWLEIGSEQSKVEYVDVEKVQMQNFNFFSID